jgi:hypothetical protein
MDFHFTGELWFWRGPSPFHFVTVPEEDARALKAVAELVTYGWGMVPVRLRIGGSETTTSLWPKDGGYIVPVKKWVQEAESLRVGDLVEVELRVAID